MKKNQYQSGLSLPELLVTLVISSILMTGIVRIFYDLKQHFMKLNQLTDLLIKKEQTFLIFMRYFREAGWLGTRYVDPHDFPYLIQQGPDEFSILHTDNSKRFRLEADRTSRIHLRIDKEIYERDQLIFSNQHAVKVTRIRSLTASPGEYEVTLDKILTKEEGWQFASIVRYYDFDLRAVTRAIYHASGTSLYIEPDLGRAEELIAGVESIQLREHHSSAHATGVHVRIQFQNSLQSKVLEKYGRLEFDVAYRKARL